MSVLLIEWKYKGRRRDSIQLCDFAVKVCETVTNTCSGTTKQNQSFIETWKSTTKFLILNIEIGLIFLILYVACWGVI